MKTGDTVKYSKPDGETEAALRFTLIEDNGSRCMIQMLDSGMAIAGIENVAREDIEKVRLTVADVKVGDTLEWMNGLGGIEQAEVFQSKTTGNLAINIGIGNGRETSVASLLRIDNGCRIAGTKRIALDGYAVGDHIVLTYRNRQGTQRRNAQVSCVNYNGNGLVTFEPRSNNDGGLSSGSGAFDPKTVGDKPYGLIHVDKTGGRSAPWKPFTPRPGDRAYDLMC